MRLTSKCDIEVPQAFAYQCLTDFAAWERAALRRGAEVERPSGAPLHGKGAAWRLRFAFRGKVRSGVVVLAGLAPSRVAEFTIDSPSLDGTSVIELQMLSPSRTRMKVALEVRPKTLAARLFINTLRLAKGTVTRRFDLRVGQVGAEIAERFRRSQRESLR
jgi:hypothetical protein